jgi:hypothetical protein
MLENDDSVSSSGELFLSVFICFLDLAYCEADFLLILLLPKVLKSLAGLLCFLDSICFSCASLCEC